MWRRGRKRGSTCPYALRSPLLHFSLFYACCVFLKVLSFFVTFLQAPHFFLPLPLFVASAGRMMGDYSTVACSAGLYHTVHAKYSPLRVCGTRERASTNDLVCACMFASRKLTLGIIIHLKGSCWASIGLPCKYAISNRLNIEVCAAMSMFN